MRKLTKREQDIVDFISNSEGGTNNVYVMKSHFFHESGIAPHETVNRLKKLAQDNVIFDSSGRHITYSMKLDREMASRNNL
jgi:hypothetical protein